MTADRFRAQATAELQLAMGVARITDAGNAEEILVGGDFYHLPPGHTGVAEEETEFIEIGEPGPHQEFVDQAKKNIAAMA